MWKAMCQWILQRRDLGGVWTTSFVASEPWELVGFYKDVRTDRELLTFICCSTMLSALIWFLWRTVFSLKYSLSLPEGNLIPPRHYTSYSFGVRDSHCPLSSMSANNVPGRGCCISLGPPWRFQQGADPSCTCSISKKWTSVVKHCELGGNCYWSRTA